MKLGKLGRATRGLKLVRNWKQKLDQLCREVVMLRDGKCQWCGNRENLQWCHINSRRYISTRWILENSLMLCAGCHLKWHHKPLEAAAWFEEKFPKRALVVRAVRRLGKGDPHLTFIGLTQEKRRLEGI